MAEKMTNDDHASGHRERLRQKLLKRGMDALETYELLEMILFYVLPRRDTKPLAKKLLHRFGSIGSVLQADPDELKKTYGLGGSSAAFFKTLDALFQRHLNEEMKARPLVNNWQKALDFCQHAMATISNEQFRVLYLDHKYNLLHDEVHREGTVDYATVYPREIIKNALNLGASNLVLAHNHPSGDSSPSQEDVELTKLLCVQAGNLGIEVLDHFIIARERYTSLKSLGYL